MAATIPNLWPDDIKVDLVPPLVILRAQADNLSRITQGILEGEVTTVPGDHDYVSHRLDLVAPALDGRQYRILVATHRAGLYPVTVEADCFRARRPADGAAAGSTAPLVSVAGTPHQLAAPSPPDWRPVAVDQAAFLKLVGEVLRSAEVRSRIDSWIAASNQIGSTELDGGATPGANPDPGAA